MFKVKIKHVSLQTIIIYSWRKHSKSFLADFKIYTYIEVFYGFLISMFISPFWLLLTKYHRVGGLVQIIIIAPHSGT